MHTPTLKVFDKPQLFKVRAYNHVADRCRGLPDDTIIKIIDLGKRSLLLAIKGVSYNQAVVQTPTWSPVLSNCTGLEIEGLRDHTVFCQQVELAGRTFLEWTPDPDSNSTASPLPIAFKMAHRVWDWLQITVPEQTPQTVALVQCLATFPQPETELLPLHQAAYFAVSYHQSKDWVPLYVVERMRLQGIVDLPLIS